MHWDGVEAPLELRDGGSLLFGGLEQDLVVRDYEFARYEGVSFEQSRERWVTLRLCVLLYRDGGDLLFVVLGLVWIEVCCLFGLGWLLDLGA